MDGRLLVVEDDPQVRSMVVRMLRYEGFEVTAAADVSTALAAVRQAPPDAVLLDLLLPDGDGIDLCRRLRAAGARFPILILTARDGVNDRVEGLDSGADDYVVKPFSSTELVARVRALLRRARAPVDGAGLRFADLVVDPAAHEARRGGRAMDLTPREFDLLVFLMQHPRQVLSRAEVMTGAWGFGTVVETNAVEVYVGYLRRKLEEGGEPRLIWTVRGAGYVLREGPHGPAHE
ncbi:MAG: response regulator transcription factor [Actinomycetota bacterium]